MVPTLTEVAVVGTFAALHRLPRCFTLKKLVQVY